MRHKVGVIAVQARMIHVFSNQHEMVICKRSNNVQKSIVDYMLKMNVVFSPGIKIEGFLGECWINIGDERQSHAQRVPKATVHGIKT